MNLILRYASGRLVEGILLAAGPDRLRIVVRRINETVELHRAEGEWMSERGDRVQIESWVTDGRQDMFEFCSRFGRRTSTATH